MPAEGEGASEQALAKVKMGRTSIGRASIGEGKN
jgi:hypothetical protein